MALTKVKLIADGVVDVDHLAANHGITTDNIGEGTALYYTDARVSSYLTTNSYATEGYVTTAVSELVASAPSTLDTLNELAAALGDDPNFATTVTNSIAGKLSLTGGTLTGTLVLNRGTFETFNASFPDYRLTINQNSGPYPRIYNYDDTGATGFHSIVIGGENNDTSGILIGEGNNPDTTVFGNLGIGTISPLSKIHIGSIGTNAYSSTITKGSNMKGIINTISSNGDDMVGIYFATGSTTEGTHWSGITGSRSDNASHWGTQLNFYTHNDDVNALNDATQKMVIKGDGKVGIGTTSPSQKLEVEGSVQMGVDPTLFWKSNILKLQTSYNAIGVVQLRGSTSYAPRFEVYNANNATKTAQIHGDGTTYFNGGNVGIGTSSPSAKLHTNLQLQGSLLSYLNGTSATFDGGANLLAVHNSPSIGSATAAGLTLANNDKSVNAISPIIAFSAKSDSNTYNHTYASIYGVRTGAGADSNWVVGDIVFATNYNTGPFERVRIKGGTGNVGINHTNPGHKLHILNSGVGSSFSKVIKLSCDPNVGGGNAIFFKTSGNDTDDRYGVKLGAVRSVNDNGSSEFIIQMESANMAGMENVFRINRERRVIIGEATGYDGDIASRSGWALNYTGGGGTTCNFSGSNEIFNFNQRDGQGTTQIDFRNGNVERGRIEWTTSGTTYNTTSDYRLKENIIDLGGCISKVQNLKPKQFNFISDPDETRIGFIAHEVEEIVPQAVSGEKDAIREDGTPKYQALDHSMLVPLLVGAIKELKAEIDSLKAQLNG